MIAPLDSDLADQTQPEIIGVIYAPASLWHKRTFMKMHPSTIMHFVMIYGRTIHEKCDNISKPHNIKLQSFFPFLQLGKCSFICIHFPQVVKAQLSPQKVVE